jgi:O-antigen/teichoic acid export membrane protein
MASTLIPQVLRGIIRKLFSQTFGSQLRRNMSSGIIATAVNTLVLAVSYPVYLHFLGYENYGLWLILATVLTFAQLGNLGIDQAIMKLVSEEHSRNDIEGMQRYVTTALALLCISGTVALVVILVLKNQIIAAFNLNAENARMVSWLLPYIGSLSIYGLVIHALNAILSGLGRMDLANYIQSAGRVVAVIVATVLLCSGRGIESLLIGNTFSYASVHIVSLICIRRIANIQLLQIKNLDAQRGKRILHFGGTVFGGSVISMLLSPFNKLMLSRYAGVSTVPVYEIAFNGSMQIRALLESGLRALMPEVSRIAANVTGPVYATISRINRRAMRLIFFFGIPVYGILAIFSPLLFRVWLGDRFVETLPGAFRIMLIGTFLSLLCVPAYYTLMGLGRVRHCFLSHVIQGIVNAGIVGVITMFAGTVSIREVALAVVVAMGITSFYVVWQNRRVTQKPLLNLVGQDHAVSAPVSCIGPEAYSE